jgi:tetratricopeptide (TPR) repeat protein
MAKKTNNKPPVTIAPKPAAPVKPQTKSPDVAKKPLSLTLKLCLVLAAVSLLVYGNTLRNGYVLDDTVVTIKNSIVTQGFAGIPELMVTPRMHGVGFFKNDNYRPLTLAMFAAEYSLFGAKPAAGHFFNIIFFAGCVVLLFLFLDKLFGRKRTVVAFIATLLFALHPIHTEVVANIKSRDEIMCFFFAFCALNAFLNYMQKGRVVQLLLGIAALFLSFISKETVITILFIIPLVFFLYRNDDKKRAMFITGASVAVAGVYLAIRSVILGKYGMSTTAIEFIDNSLAIAPNIMVRIATAILVMGMYIKLLFAPYPLNCDYAYDTIPFVGLGNIWVLLTVAIYLFIGAYGILRLIKDKKDPWAFGMLFFLATMALFTNVFFLTGSQMGERFLFFSSVGFCLVIALAIEKWIIKKETDFPGLLQNKTALGVLVVICLLFSGLTIARNNDWKDNYTLYKTDLEKAPRDCRLYFYLGDEMSENTYAEEKDTAKQRQILNESIALMIKSLQIFPDYTDEHTELGKAYLMKGDYDSAIAHFKRAIALSDYQSIAANNLGTAYLRTGKLKEAIGAYNLAIKINGGFVAAYYNLGCTYAQTQQADSAVYVLNKVLSFDPNYLNAYMQLGIVYYNSGKMDLAIANINKVLQADPNNVDAMNTLGAVYLRLGKLPQALDLFKKVVTINPNYVNGYSNMAHCYYQMKQYQATIDAINKELSLNPRAVNDVPYIALCYQAMGNMEMALKYEAISKQYFANFKLN